jgi:hypothetical protein
MKDARLTQGSLPVVIAVVLALSLQLPAQVEAVEARTAFGRAFQTRLLAMGIAADVGVDGKESRALRVRSQQLTPQSVFKIVSTRAANVEARRLGFREIVFIRSGNKPGRGCCEQWSYSLERESMIWLPSSSSREGGRKSVAPTPFHPASYQNARSDMLVTPMTSDEPTL